MENHFRGPEKGATSFGGTGVGGVIGGDELEIGVGALAIGGVETEPFHLVGIQIHGRVKAATTNGVILDHEPRHAALAESAHADAFGLHLEPGRGKHAALFSRQRVVEHARRIKAAQHPVPFDFNAKLACRNGRTGVTARAMPRSSAGHEPTARLRAAQVPAVGEVGLVELAAAGQLGLPKRRELIPSLLKRGAGQVGQFHPRMKRAGVVLRGVRQRGIPRLHRVRRIELPGLGHPKLFQLSLEVRPFLELCWRQ